MKLSVCGSVDVAKEMKEVVEKLEKAGHELEIPYYVKKIISGEVDINEYLKIKSERGDVEFRNQADEDLIKRHFKNINNCDAIFVFNINKKGIENYIGGNTFLEIGFAHVLGKNIFLLNPIPEVSYKDELVAMNPIILNGDLSLIK